MCVLTTGMCDTICTGVCVLAAAACSTSTPSAGTYLALITGPPALALYSQPPPAPLAAGAATAAAGLRALTQPTWGLLPFTPGAPGPKGE